MNRHEAVALQPSPSSGTSNPQYGSSDLGRYSLKSPISSPDGVWPAIAPATPSDTWQNVKPVGGSAKPENQPVGKDARVPPNATTPQAALNNHAPGVSSYRLIREGKVDVITINQLLDNYQRNYHDYLPLVPKHFFKAKYLDHFAAHNKHLLTAILTIASKDIPGDRSNIHEDCCRYMFDLISAIAAGTDTGVEAVEAQILLAEWVPQGLRASGKAIGRGEEDRTAWMQIGMALRNGYYLGLDRTSFRNESSREKTDARKRLAWIYGYISDRLVSCRVGRGFWSRGPGFGLYLCLGRIWCPRRGGDVRIVIVDGKWSLIIRRRLGSRD